MDSNDVIKMKVLDLRRELKSRGLSASGCKAILITRLKAAISPSQDSDDSDDSDDSYEINSDRVLDEDATGQNNHKLDSVIEELALADHPLPAKSATVESKRLHWKLKRKLATDAAKKGDTNVSETKEAKPNKIILKRTASVTPPTPCVIGEKSDHTSVVIRGNITSSNNKISADLCDKSKLALRAERLSLLTNMTNAQRKAARIKRFSQNTSSVLSTEAPDSRADHIEKLKKRAKRFGLSVSKIMTDIETKEKMERRRIRFGNVK